MNTPGDFSLLDLSITTALASVAQTPIQSLEGMLAVTLEARFAYGTGGTTAKAWVQVTLDDGLSWLDIACFAFTTTSAIKLLNLSGLTPVVLQVTASDGAMTDNTCQDGILGSAMRTKVTTTGTYANTSLSVKLSAR